MKRRNGIFYFNRGVIDPNSPHSEDQEFLYKVFSELKFIPLSVVLKFQNDRFEYVGSSPFFREVDEHEHLPYYIINIEEIEGGEVRLEVIENESAAIEPNFSGNTIKRIDKKW